MEAAREALDPDIQNYDDLHQASLDQPGPFWRLVWDFCGMVGEPGEIALENAGKMPGARWFP